MKNIFQKLIIYFLTIIIVLANFSLLLAPKKAKAESEFSDWNGSSANFDKSQLEFSDNKLIHTFEISSNQQRQITFQKVGPVNLWDFYKWKYHTDTSASATSGQFYGTPPMPEEGYDINKNIYDKFQTLSSYDYELYKMPDTGQTPLYLIVRRKSTTSGETVGLFSHNLTLHPLRRDLRMVGISPTHQNAYRLETISTKQIEWKPYLYAGFSDTRVEGDFLAIFFNNGALHNVKYDDRDQYGNRGANLYKYIQYFNQRIYAIGEGTAAECPPEAGKSHSVEEYSRCFFQNEGATFNVNSSGPNTFKADQSTSPTITLDEKTWPDGAKRPKISFTLKKVIRARGFERDNRNYMYFFATNPDYPNLAIIFTDCDPNGRLIIKGPSNDISNEEKIGNIGITVNPEIWWSQLINRIYNSGTGAVTTFPNSAEYAVNNCPDIKYINVSDDGWLEKWRVESAEDAGGGEARESTCITGGGGLKYASAAWWISQALCAILEFIGNIGQWITDVFFLSVFNAYSPTTKPMETSYYISPNNDILISRAYAYEAQKGDEVPPLSDALSGKTDKWDWIITVWKFTLGLANLFLVVVLLFLGVVNILHIQYDTYAIKKMLPLLIIGVILANFSLLIMRMLIDASDILTNSFMGNQTPGNMLKDLINAVSINDQNPGFFKAWENVGILLLAVIFAVFAIAGFLILGIMFYIRFAAIVLLGIIAPLAFVAMAFPPTQTVFKQWWSWASKMIFMKPIAFFLLMLALKVKGAPGSTLSITAWIIIVALVYMAILVPWKLGGAVMGMWGGAMGSLFGTKKGGWARKPVAAWAQRKVDVAKGALATRFGNTALGRFIDRGRKFDEMRLEDYKQARETQMSERGKEIKTGTERFDRTKHEAERAKTTLEEQEQVNLATILNGTEAEETEEEKIRLINAKGEVERVSAVAEENVREGLGEAQNLREMEVAKAKEEVDIDKQERDENIREGNVENLTGAQIEEITGLSAATGENTPVNVKSRYLEQSNKLSIVKERATKRTISDVEIIAQRDSKMNNNLRQTMEELKEAGRKIDSTYALDGNALAAGTTEKVTWTEAREAAEQLRYRATSAEGDERVRLENVAQYFDTQAAAFETANANYDTTMVQDLDNRQAALRLQATTAATPEQRKELEETADRMMNASRIVREKIATAAASGKPAAIGYREYYLTNNLAGRRQKIINPDVADEIHTAVITNPASSLYLDVLANKPVGAGEAKTNREGIYTTINGRMSDLDEAQARGAMIQLGAIHTVMSTARQGETKGLSQINGMMQIMEGAGRNRFKVAAARSAIDAMPPTNRNSMRKEAMRQEGTDWAGLTAAGQEAAWAGLTAAEQEAALQNLNFEQLNIKGTSPDAVAQRDFVDRFLDRFEEDEGMALTSSPGTRASKSRVVDPRNFTENR